MTDHSTPNLPSRDFQATSAFFSKLGFLETWRDEDWMILERGSVVLEFFPHRELDPSTNGFSCCLRLEDVEGFYRTCEAAGLEAAKEGQPRLQAIETQAWGARAGALLDPDGTLYRLIQN